MNYIISNIGWFGGTMFVIILALIGYHADKNEKNREIEKKEINSTPLNKEVDNEPFSGINESSGKQETENKSLIEENSISNIEEKQKNKEYNSINNDISSPYFNNFSNIESLNMSLEDLEKKNYNEIINKKIEEKEIIPDFTNSNDYLDETLANTINHEFDNEVEQNTNIIDNENMTENKNQEKNVENPVNQVNELEISNEENVDEKSEKIDNIIPEIDSETNAQTENVIPAPEQVWQTQTEDSEIIQQENKEETDSAWEFNKDEEKYEGEIPELFGNIETNDNDEKSEIDHWEKFENTESEHQNSNIYSNSTDDDIWKF